jgi:NAD(P)-dependent dehydrogenase (short-subunit alcohol dehydrogenase family)
VTEREDRQDISEVLLRYATGIDRRNWPLFRAAFTDDCELDYGEIGTWHGVDAVTEFMETSHAMAGHTMHRLTNQVITVEGDRLRRAPTSAAAAASSSSIPVAGFVGAPNMVAYGATKAFDMVFAEALWGELHDEGVDVLGLILGKTDTPALRRLEREMGTTATEDEPSADAATVSEVVAAAFENLSNGPTHLVGETMRAGMQMLTSLPRNDAVQLMVAASAASMGTGSS